MRTCPCYNHHLTSNKHRGHCVSNLDWLLNTLFTLKSKKPPKTVTSDFYSQTASNAENDSMSWCRGWAIFDVFGTLCIHYDVIKWKYFRVTGHLCGEFTSHRWISGWVHNREAGDFRRHRAHYDVIVMSQVIRTKFVCCCVLSWLMLRRGSVKKGLL